MKNAFLIILILLAVFGVWQFKSMRLSELTLESQNISSGGEGEKYAIEAKYPKVTRGIPKKSAEIINTEMGVWAKAKTDDAEKWFRELALDEIAVPEYATLSYVSEYKTHYDFSFAPYVNFKFENYSYSGGAHGGTSVTTFAFNAKTGKKVILNEIFSGDFLKVLSEESLNQIKAIDPNLETYTFTEDGLQPKIENFNAWQILPEGFHLTFGDYQVGPYAAGRPEITIPWSKLENVLKPEFVTTLKLAK